MRVDAGSADVVHDGAVAPLSRAWTDPVSLALLADLKAAPPGQRLLLQEQIATLSLWIWRLCVGWSAQTTSRPDPADALVFTLALELAEDRNKQAIEIILRSTTNRLADG